MKKKIKIVILLILIIYLIFFIKRVLTKEHHVTYSIGNYTVEEFFTANDSQYDFVVKKGENNYQFSINEDLNKSKRIIDHIKTFTSNNLVCITPVFKKTKIANLYCNLDKKQVSIYSLMETNNPDFKKIQEKGKNYNFIYPSLKETKKTYKKLEVYQNNILKEDTFIMWDYKGIYLIEKEKNKYQKIFDYDLYDNLMVTLVDKYYVLFENSSVSGIENIYYYDLEKGKLKNYHLEVVLSKDSYINGVVDNDIYVTDNKKKKEYRINIAKEEIEELKEYIIWKNNKKKVLSKSDYFLSPQYFSIEKTHYNYYLEDSKFYKAIKKDLDHPIFLFELEEVEAWEVVEDEIILLKEDTIYSYTEEAGLRKIIENSELKYNYKDIYKCWKK